jgi:GT2 family glycosyltransferase
VTYNSASVLPGLLDSLPAGLEGVKSFEAIVVDNESSDDSVDIALAHAVKPRVIKMGRNAGYAAGINAAAATVHPKANLLILNPDIRLLKGTAGLLVNRLMDPSVGVAVPRLLTDGGTTRWSLRREPSTTTAWAEAILGGMFAARIGAGEMITDPAVYEKAALIEWATGSILAVAARARSIVGDWDESFFLYMEEVEYLRRVRESGFSAVYVPEAKAVHLEGEYRENARLFALLTANRIRYHRRYHGPLSTGLFRLGVVVGEGIRSVRGAPAHKAAVWAALTSKLPSEADKM